MKTFITAWDTCKSDEYITDYMENYNDQNDEEDSIDLDKARELYCMDFDTHQWEWEDMLSLLDEALGKLNNGRTWKATGHSMGWRNLEGYKTFRADNAEQFLNELLPDCEKTFSIERKGKTLFIRCSHHDSPMGETYEIRPCLECPHCAEGIEEKYKRVCDSCRV